MTKLKLIINLSAFVFLFACYVSFANKSEAATYNFIFNNTEQGDNSTATPKVTVQDGKLVPNQSPEAAINNIGVQIEEPQKSKKYPIYFGVGGGANFYQGNLGRLYSTATALDMRLGMQLDPIFDLKLGTVLSKTNYNAFNTGYVDVNSTMVDLTLLAHMLPSKNNNGKLGLDPYIFLGATRIWKKQNFATYFNVSETSKSFGLNAGLGTNIFISKDVCFWLEGKIDQNLFDDRFSSDFSDSGISDLTGSILSSSAGIKYYF